MNSKAVSSIINVSSVLIFFLLVLPAFDQTRMLRGSIEERENILTETQEISNRISELNRSIESKKQEVDKLDQLLPREKEIPELLSNIESIVSASGLILSEINLSEFSGQNEIGKINGTMKLSGNFVSFMNFLDLLEKNLRLIDVITVDAAAQAAEGTRTINYDVRFEASYLIVQ